MGIHSIQEVLSVQDWGERMNELEPITEDLLYEWEWAKQFQYRVDRSSGSFGLVARSLSYRDRSLRSRKR
jgi:hypothetical protein